MAVSNGHSSSADEPRHINAEISEDENLLAGPIFTPPVYQQRYDFVRNLIRRLQPKKVVDMGCAECKLLRLLKFEECIDELIGVDLDLDTLQHNKRHFEPLATDYIFRRPRPFRIQLLQGSISHPDSVLRDADVFSCIEVIEHLEEPTLEDVPQAIFGTIRPKVAIISTPNSEFNILFPGFTGFRHSDHKFEWTRSQFQTWCSRVCDLYGYSVEYSGVGNPPSNRTSLGQCSQIATFTRLSDDRPTVNRQLQYRNNYQTVFDCEYPYEINTLSPEEKLCLESEYYIRVLLRNYQQENDDESEGEIRNDDESEIRNDDESEGEIRMLESDPPDTIFIKLDELMVFRSIRRLTSDVDSIRHSLICHSEYQVRSHQDSHYVVVFRDNGGDSDEGEDNGEGSDEGEEENENEVEYRNGSEHEDWDNESG